MASEVSRALLQELSGALYRRNSSFLATALPLDNESLSRPPYTLLETEIKQRFPQLDSDAQDKRIEKHCETLLPVDQDWEPDGTTGTSWTAFILFIKEYFVFLRDRTPSPVELHERMVSVLIQCVSALSHPSLGIIVLDLCLAYSETLKTVSLKLEHGNGHASELFNHRLQLKREGKSSYPVTQTPAERVAEIFQKALNQCLADRTDGGGPGNRFARPAGKRLAIYKLANLIAKCMFGSGNISGLTTLFTNIQQLGPPLEYFPASQRVCYLYHLGRYHSHYDNLHRAVQCLNSAYIQCPRQFVKQRRQILRILLADSILLGRFPSQNLLSRPEAKDLDRVFLPPCFAIRSGNFRQLKAFVGISNYEDKEESEASQAAYAQIWLRKFGLLYKFQSILLNYTWRCLIRKVFMIAGFHGEGKRPPTLGFDEITKAAEIIDPYLIWPEGIRPWYQDIGDRQIYVNERRQEWQNEIQRDWEEDPNPNSKRWEWEPDYDELPTRWRRKLPFGRGQPEDEGLALNDDEIKEWETLEDQRQRTLRRYSQMLQNYKKGKSKSGKTGNVASWMKAHKLPLDNSEAAFQRWWQENVRSKDSENQPRMPNQVTGFGTLSGHSPFDSNDTQDGMDTDDGDDWIPSAPKANIFGTRSNLRGGTSDDDTPLFLPDEDAIPPTDWNTAWDNFRRPENGAGSPNPSVSSFDSTEAANALWTGGTFLSSEPQPLPELLPNREYPPGLPRTPPLPINTDNIIINELSNLVAHRLINGFVSAQTRKFAIEGAKRVGPVEAGFPRIWDVMVERAVEAETAEGVKPGWIPGWVREEFEPASTFGGGVVRLGGARAAGS